MNKIFFAMIVFFISIFDISFIVAAESDTLSINSRNLADFPISDSSNLTTNLNKIFGKTRLYVIDLQQILQESPNTIFKNAFEKNTKNHCESSQYVNGIDSGNLLSFTKVTYVYITKTGKKYHRLGCRYLKQSSIRVTLDQACLNGYQPCKVCRPPSCTSDLDYEDQFCAKLLGAVRLQPTIN